MDNLQRLDEGRRILDGDLCLERLSALDQAIAFDDVQLVAVRRAEIIDEGLGGTSKNIIWPPERKSDSVLCLKR